VANLIVLFRRGQYSGAVLDELESQNDAQVEGIMGKVKILKNVSGNPRLPYGDGSFLFLLQERRSAEGDVV